MALFAGAWVVLPFAFYVWFAVAAGLFPVFQPFNELINSNKPEANLIFAIVDAIGSLAIIGYLLHRTGANWRDLGFRGFSWWKALLYIGGLFIAFILVVQILYVVVQLLVPGFNPDEPQTNDFDGLATSLRGWLPVVLVVLPAFVEETVFRGFVFPALSKRFGLIAGAAISSFLFGLAHVQPNVIVYTFVIGLVLCFLYVRLGSIIPGIALHAFNNYIAFIAISQS